jgi:hypothetical protein
MPRATLTTTQSLTLSSGCPLKWVHRLDLTVSFSSLGREQEAREAAKEVLRLDPEFSIEKYAISINMLFQNQEDKKQYVDALRKAGLK